jgi:hypothetical protein
MEITMKETYKTIKRMGGALSISATEKNIAGVLYKMKYTGMAGITFCLELSTKEIGAVE